MAGQMPRPRTTQMEPWGQGIVYYAPPFNRLEFLYFGASFGRQLRGIDGSAGDLPMNPSTPVTYFMTR